MRRRTVAATPAGLEAACPVDVAKWARKELGMDERTIAYWYEEFCDAVRAGKFKQPILDWPSALRSSLRHQVGRPVPAHFARQSPLERSVYKPPSAPASSIDPAERDKNLEMLRSAVGQRRGEARP